MNKFILSIALACISGLSAHAQFTGKGYYRVQNTGTQRYMSLSDNTARVWTSHPTQWMQEP